MLIVLRENELVRGYFASELSLLLRHTDEPQKGRNSCLWLQSRYVLSSFSVLLMSCRVNFHVVRSALQYSACRIICLHFMTGASLRLGSGNQEYSKQIEVIQA